VIVIWATLWAMWYRVTHRDTTWVGATEGWSPGKEIRGVGESGELAVRWREDVSMGWVVRDCMSDVDRIAGWAIHILMDDGEWTRFLRSSPLMEGVEV
jgi:hypothetical protein